MTADTLQYWTYNQHFKSWAPLLAEYERYGEIRPIVADGLDILAKRLKWRTAHNFQNVIEINGGTGTGKSTCAIQLAYKLNPKWDLEKNYIYTVKDLKEKLKDWKNADPISLFDEGSVVLNSLDTMSKSSKDIVMLFDTMRVLRWTTIICIPDHNTLNKRVRDFHIDYRLICPSKPLIKRPEVYDKRGFVEIHNYSRSDFGKGYAPLVMTTTFNDIPPRVREIYDKIKLDHLMDRMVDFANEGED